MKKIIFKSEQFPVMSETFITNQVVAAIEMGYDVSIIVDTKNDHNSSSQTELLHKYNLLPKTFEIKNQRPKNLFRIFFLALKLVLTKYPVGLLKTFNYFKYKKPGLSGRLFYDLVSIYPFLDADIFHVQFGIFAEPLIRLKKTGLLKAKIITTFHGFDANFTKNTFDKKKKFYQELFITGTSFTVNTEYLANKLIQLECPPSKLEIVPMGIDVTYFKPLPEKEEKKEMKLVSVGRLLKWKSHELGIQITAELIKRGYLVSYTIIGEGEERENLEQLIKELNLAERVFLLGAKKQQFIRDTLQQSDIFLMTSTHDDEGRRETQGVVTGEAQACGLPVCAFNSGGVPYTLIDGETGFLSKENDRMDMTGNIEKLITNSVLRKKMSVRARQFIEENYSLKISAAKMQLVYQSLLV